MASLRFLAESLARGVLVAVGGRVAGFSAELSVRGESVHQYRGILNNLAKLSVVRTLGRFPRREYRNNYSSYGTNANSFAQPLW